MAPIVMIETVMTRPNSERRSAMGEPLDREYKVLWQEVALVHAMWGQYCALFRANQKRVELLNQASGFFFRIVQDTLHDEILLSIARLTGSAKSCGKRNLTLKRLPSSVDQGLRSTVQAKVDAAESIADFCRDWRS
jgi:hypothetical protein